MARTDAVTADQTTLDAPAQLLLALPQPGHDTLLRVLLRNLVDFRIMSRSWSAKNKSENVQDYKAKEDSFASRNTNGTGPYVIKEWVPDQRIVLTANKNWWDKLQGNVTDVIYTPIKSDPTRIAAVQTGRPGSFRHQRPQGTRGHLRL